MIAEILYQNKEADDNAIIIKYFGNGEYRSYAMIDKKYASIFVGFFDPENGNFLNVVKNPRKPVDIVIVLITTPLDNKEIPLEIIEKAKTESALHRTTFFKKKYNMVNQQIRNYTTGSIRRLIKALDFDKDDRIGILDLKYFCEKNCLVFADDLIEQMIVSSNRNKYAYLTNMDELDRKLCDSLNLND